MTTLIDLLECGALALCIATGAVFAVMGAAAILAAFFPNLEEHEACKYEPTEEEEDDEA